jgi:hypothetical protein
VTRTYTMVKLYLFLGFEFSVFGGWHLWTERRFASLLVGRRVH